MGKPSAPEPPNPVQTAAASNSTNINTAIANAMMGNVNQVTPNGSLSYDQTGSYSYKDPFTGQTYQVPRFTATQTLSPQQQAIQDQNQGAQQNLASIANDRSGFLKDYLGGAVDTSGLPGLMGSAGQSSTIGNGYNPSFGSNVGGSYNPNFGSNVGNGYNAAFGQGVDGYNSAFGQNVGNGYNSQFGQNVGGSYSNTLGPGYQTDLGSGYTNGVNLATSYAGADDFSADRQRVEDALWDRSASQRAQDDEALRTRLLNSGIREGSAAWDSEMQRMAAQNTDARLATIAAGGQEQSRLVGLAQQAAQFGNDATLQQAGFGNNAALQSGQFTNDALSNQLQLQNAASLGQAQFGQQAQGLQNAAALAQAQYGSQQQQAGNAAALGLASYGSQQQQAQNAAALGLASYGQQAQQLGNAASLGLAQYGSSQQQAGNAAALAGAQFGNNANLTNAQFQNAARGQGLQETYAARNQPLNEILGLMSGTQVQNPNFVNTNMPTIPTTDVAGILNANYQNQLGAYNAQQQSLGGLISGAAAGAGMLLGAPQASILGGLMGYGAQRPTSIY
ncbi:hypothetical protein [Xanthobacter sediminis]